MQKQLTCLLFLLVIVITAHSQAYPKGLQVSDKAPAFSAKDQNGNMRSLDALKEKGKVVIIFYRGQWCPYCNRQLKQLEDSLSLITAKNALLIAVTPERTENISKTIKKTKASFPIVFDDGLRIMKEYKVAFTVDTATIQKYKSYGIDFNEANGANGAVLPVPAVYIINQSGIITYAFFDTNYAKRPSVKDLLEHL